MGKVDQSNPEVNDVYGYSTLESISGADKFNRWMYETIKPFCKGRILEIGGGIGNISQCFLSDGEELVVTELQSEYCTMIRKRFGDHPHLKDVLEMDIVDADFDTKYEQWFGTFDTVFALNVVEHIEDHQKAIANCKKLLKKGGRLIILVPAFQSLYNHFDTALGHFRRYTCKTLKTVFDANGLTIVHQQYFNLIGMAGWWVSGSLLRKKIIPEGQMKLYNFFVPVFRLVDLFSSRLLGLSVIMVGEVE
ncbi:MAG TPA: class I SAM-dependent methyltransferase [Prolixibacteraceae bacterium]|jgi:2-polyprenyl-3-methyl-5-hydroxy-6-metoxy-1,4-benzoquinol methylase|nr:class I SAM-dependent methyltransferase [Prolixibacteraceae bacterium]